MTTPFVGETFPASLEACMGHLLATHAAKGDRLHGPAAPAAPSSACASGTYSSSSPSSPSAATVMEDDDSSRRSFPSTHSSPGSSCPIDSKGSSSMLSPPPRPPPRTSSHLLSSHNALPPPPPPPPPPLQAFLLLANPYSFHASSLSPPSSSSSSSPAPAPSPSPSSASAAPSSSAPRRSGLALSAATPFQKELAALLSSRLLRPPSINAVEELHCPLCACVLHNPVVFACGLSMDEACAACFSTCPCRRPSCHSSPSYALATIVEAVHAEAVQAAKLANDARKQLMQLWTAERLQLQQEQQRQQLEREQRSLHEQEHADHSAQQHQRLQREQRALDMDCGGALDQRNGDEEMETGADGERIQTRSWSPHSIFSSLSFASSVEADGLSVTDSLFSTLSSVNNTTTVNASSSPAPRAISVATAVARISPPAPSAMQPKVSSETAPSLSPASTAASDSVSATAESTAAPSPRGPVADIRAMRLMESEGGTDLQDGGGAGTLKEGNTMGGRKSEDSDDVGTKGEAIHGRVGALGESAKGDRKDSKEGKGIAADPALSAPSRSGASGSEDATGAASKMSLETLPVDLRPVFSLLERSLAIAPTSHALCLRAQVFSLAGFEDRAKADLASALRFSPHLLPAHISSAQLELCSPSGSAVRALCFAISAWTSLGQVNALALCEEVCKRIVLSPEFQSGPAAVASRIATELSQFWTSLHGNGSSDGSTSSSSSSGGGKSSASPAGIQVSVETMAAHPAVRGELECKLCLNVLCMPLTTPCGHAFCQACLLRVMDQSPSCPLCRQPLQSFIAQRNFNVTTALARLVDRLYAAELQERRIADTMELRQSLPIFICSISLPGVECGLHIYEPRYRLLMRRAWETDRCFGMVAGTMAGPLDCGTLLYINNMHYTSDGRSFVSTVGRRRFRVLEWGVKDEYAVGTKIEWIDDEPDPPEASPSLEELNAVGRSMVMGLRSQVAWQEVVHTLGEPPEDAALLPFWMSQAFGLSGSVQYNLLSQRSARERYLQVLFHIRQMNQCTIL